MDAREQFELMAAIRAYARQIAEMPPHDVRPSTAYNDYRLKIVRMDQLQHKLNCSS